MHEEALYRVEEERYEFDLNIEANLHTITLLETVHRNLQEMSPEERSKFQLQLGLGGECELILIIYSVSGPLRLFIIFINRHLYNHIPTNYQKDLGY